MRYEILCDIGWAKEYSGICQLGLEDKVDNSKIDFYHRLWWGVE